MSDPYMGEIRMFGFDYAPKNYARCDGAILQTSKNQALFALLGDTYGGNGSTTFALPDFRGRVPVSWGQGLPLGLQDGQEAVTIDLSTLAMHTHDAKGTTEEGDAIVPVAGRCLATSDDPIGDPIYGQRTSSLVALNTNILGDSAGSGGPHNNMQPSQVINFCIAVSGLFPTRN